MRTRVYVAGPLSSSGDRLANVRDAILVGIELIRAGYAPLIPHLTHYIEFIDGRLGVDNQRVAFAHQVWLDVDLPWVSCADAVLRLPGQSVGADMETDMADSLGIPVYDSIEDLIRGLPANVPSPPEPSAWRSGDARFHAILDEMGRIHAKKAQDYGSDADPFANIRAAEDIGIEPWRGAWLRALDKVRRIIRYCVKGELANEGVEDSLIDLASYCIIALILFREAVQSVKPKLSA